MDRAVDVPGIVGLLARGLNSAQIECRVAPGADDIAEADSRMVKSDQLTWQQTDLQSITEQYSQSVARQIAA